MTTSLVPPARGKAARLVDERALPGHLKCSSCQQPVYNSYQTPHGCRLCQTCVDNLPPQEKVPCPGKTDACRDKEEEIDICQATCFPDMASRREVGKQKVFCPNKAEGCGAQFLWREVESHLNGCNFEKVQCDMCGERKLKRDMQDHQLKECRQRPVEYSGCQAMVVAGVIDSEHRSLLSSTCCAAFSAPCPLCGDGQMKRPHYMRHLTTCRQKPTACKFAHVGCDTVAAAARLDAHYRDAADRHMGMVDARLKAAAAASAGAAPRYYRHSCLMWKITDAAARRQEARRKQGVKRLFSPLFALGPFQFRAFVYLNGWAIEKDSHVSVYLALVQGPPPGSTKWPFCGRVTFDLPEGSSGPARCTAVVRINTRHRKSVEAGDLSLHWGEPRFLPTCRLDKFVHLDGCIEMTVTVVAD